MAFIRGLIQSIVVNQQANKVKERIVRWPVSATCAEKKLSLGLRKYLRPRDIISGPEILLSTHKQWNRVTKWVVTSTVIICSWSETANRLFIFIVFKVLKGSRSDVKCQLQLEETTYFHIHQSNLFPSIPTPVHVQAISSYILKKIKIQTAFALCIYKTLSICL